MPRPKVKGGGEAIGKIPSSSSMEYQKRNTYLNKQKQQQEDQQ